MGDKKQRAHGEKAAKVAAIRAAQQRRERRQKVLIYGAVAVVCLTLITAVAIPFMSQKQRQAAPAAGAPIGEVQKFEGLSSDHVAGTVEYAMSPPAGGDHNGVWQNCGVYTEPVVNENAVHSLEHGAVWITYSSDLPDDQVAALATKAQGQEYALLSPYQDLGSPIVLSAWGAQLAVAEADDPRVDEFLVQHLQGEQTPEPGAPCYGGTGTPEA